MDFVPTKQLPGKKVQMEQTILEDLKKLDPKRFGNTLSFFGGHPISLVKQDENKMFEQLNQKKASSPFLVCQKTDGVRYLLIITNSNHYFVSREGKRNLVSYESQCQVAKNWHFNSKGDTSEVVHVLDGEMINDRTKNGQQKIRYLIFDALIVFQKIIIDKTLKQRLDQCEKFLRCNDYLLKLLGETQFPHTAIQVKLKDFFRLSCNTYVSSEVFRQRRLESQPTTMQFIQKFYIQALPHENDGIIFNHEQKPYLLGVNNGYLKWKPSQLNTVDFLIIPNTKFEGPLSRRVLDLYLGWRDNQTSNIYRMMFYNFTIVSEEDFEDLEKELQVKYENAYEQNPDQVVEDNFGIIAECKYIPIKPTAPEFGLFKQIFSSNKKPEEIQQMIMKQQNEQKELQIIKKLQGLPYSKYWKVYRIRNDKNMPNNHQVTFKIEQSIKDDIKYQDLVKKNKQLIDNTRMNH